MNLGFRLGLIFGLTTVPVAANAAWSTLQCQFTNAAQISLMEDGKLGLSNFRLPDDFFKPFSMRTNGNQLIDITISRWSFGESLGFRRECYSDAVSINCAGNFGNSIFFDKKSFLGSANIMSGSGYGEPVTVSYFRCEIETP